MDNRIIHFSGIDLTADYFAVAYALNRISSPLHIYMPEAHDGCTHAALTIYPAVTGDPVPFAAALSSFTEDRSDEIQFYPISTDLSSDGSVSSVRAALIHAMRCGRKGAFFVCARVLQLAPLHREDLPFTKGAEWLIGWDAGRLTTYAEDCIARDISEINARGVALRDRAPSVISYVGYDKARNSEYPWCSRSSAYIDTVPDLPLERFRARQVPYYHILNLEHLAVCFTDLRLGIWYLVTVDSDLCSVTSNPNVRALLGVPEHFPGAWQSTPYCLNSSRGGMYEG